MVRGKAHKQIQRLHDMSDEVANATCPLVGDSLEVLKGSFRKSLQRSVSEYYDKNTPDGTKAYVNDSLVPFVKDEHNTVVRMLGGAQQQLLVLSHIISLAERCGVTCTRNFDRLGIKVGKLDDQSFSLDSIFAPCDKNMAGVVANSCRNRARQMVVLVAPHPPQWHEGHETRPQMEKAADKVYRFNFHTDKEPNDEQDCIVTYGKKNVALWTRTSWAWRPTQPSRRLNNGPGRTATTGEALLPFCKPWSEKRDTRSLRRITTSFCSPPHAGIVILKLNGPRSACPSWRSHTCPFEYFKTDSQNASSRPPVGLGGI
jgi:hypothetical protein